MPTAPQVHEREKLAVLHMMQELSLARGFRCTFMSGDVHVAGMGRFQSNPKINLRNDHRYMSQVRYWAKLGSCHWL